MKNMFYLMAFALLLGQWAQAQSKRPLTHEVYDSWKSVNAEAISQDGQWVIYQLNPQEGDPQLFLKDIRKREDKTKSFVRASQASLSADSKFLVFKISPPLDSIKQQRRQKVKKENLPKDTLAIYALLGDSLLKIPNILSFKVPAKEGSAVAYLLAPEKKAKESNKKPVADSTQKDSTQLQKPIEEKAPINTQPESLEEAQQLIEALKAQLAAIETHKNKPKEKEKPKPKAPKVENEKNGHRLVLRDLLTARQDTFLYVTQYLFDEKGTKLAFVSSGKDSLQFTAGVYVYDLNKKALQQVLNLPGKHQNLAWDEAGTQLAFVSDTDTTKANEKALVRYFDLYYWQEKQKIATKLAEKGSPGLPKDWLISEHSSPRFAKDGSKLYFGTQTPPIVKDTTLLPEEIVSVDVWHWQDARLQSQQNVELERNRKKSYWAVAYPKSRRLVQLGSPEIPNVLLAAEGNAEFAIGLASEPYESNMSWEGYPAYQDVYYLSFRDGSKQKIREKLRANVRISPDGQYLYWYAVQDTSWYSYSLKTRQSFNLTKRVNNRFYDEFHDYPDAPREYGEAGWLEKDSHLLLYDRFDIWKFHPEMREAPIRLTNNGRENGLSYRYINLDPELNYIKSDEPALLYVFDEESKGTGYFTTLLTAPATPRKLLLEEARFSYPQKAKAANRFIFTRESFKDSPDLYYTDQNFTKPNRLSDANPQQAQYLWGTVELVKWTSMDGDELQGLLYKPENFDAGKKYPMITYFYERVTDRMHNYIAPAPSASTIRASEYVSNGYLVFMPDIPYKVGYPGQSAYDAIVSGVTQLLKQPFVDRDRLGIQGQSWGGYQVAYLVTRSNLFAAAMAGAPVANMTSAYGGIRWGTGISRMFQYEHTQSRIGKTLWEDPLLYMENSPLFKADRVETPLLMMHNDADGAVPWYQGIEMFMALKRLGKPVWLLTYNGEDHNLRFRQNRKDLSIRMQQFFDYYLKFAPAPEWMKNGVPAIEKGIKMRYELIKE
jgi:dipeptidyl aminopeptidase/acylaminoacyl peptidase